MSEQSIDENTVESNDNTQPTPQQTSTPTQTLTQSTQNIDIVNKLEIVSEAKVESDVQVENAFTDKLDNFVEWFINLYSEHPKSRGMTVPQHFFNAMKLSILTFITSIIFLIHAMAPFVFQDTGSNMMNYIVDTHLKNNVNSKQSEKSKIQQQQLQEFKSCYDVM